MLTFAAPSAPAQTRGFDFSDYTLHGASHAAVAGIETTSASERAAHLAQTRYWPSDLLDTFILKMAAAGQCVHTAMMLGDRHYAMVQLATARLSHDDTLVALSSRLQAYFEADAPEACMVATAMSQETDSRFLVV